MHVDSSDIGMSSHFLVWLELGRAAKCYRKQKHSGVKKGRLNDKNISIPQYPSQNSICMGN